MLHNHAGPDIIHLHEVATHGPRAPFNLRIASGERVALIGPDEATKAALFTLLSGDSGCQSGQALFKGMPMADWTAHELGLCRAVLTQRATADARRPASAMIALGRSGRRGDTRLAHIVLAAAQQAHAEHLLGRRYHTLTPDERARVQLARVFAQLWDVQHGLLVLDEPLADVAPELQRPLAEALERFVRTRAHTLIVALRDLSHALHYCDRLLVAAQHGISADMPADGHALQAIERITARRDGMHDTLAWAA